MQGNGFLEVAGIPLLLFAVLVYYGVRLWIMKDVTIVRGKHKPPVKDEAMYVKSASLLILFLAFATLVMAFVAPYGTEIRRLRFGFVKNRMGRRKGKWPGIRFCW